MPQLYLSQSILCQTNFSTVVSILKQLVAFVVDVSSGLHTILCMSLVKLDVCMRCVEAQTTSVQIHKIASGLF